VRTRGLAHTGFAREEKITLCCLDEIHQLTSLVGRRVLLVSTDLASNLDEVLGVGLSPQPTGIPGTAASSGFVHPHK
jgi:arsenite-transporting ATPase